LHQAKEVEYSLRSYIEKIESNQNHIVRELREEQANKIEVINDCKIKKDEIAKLQTELN